MGGIKVANAPAVFNMDAQKNFSRADSENRLKKKRILSDIRKRRITEQDVLPRPVGREKVEEGKKKGQRKKRGP